MTLESRTNRNSYIGNGAATQFPFYFKVWKKDQVLVFVGDGVTETDVSAQCAVEITSTGGTVTFPSAPGDGQKIVIRRSMPFVQEDDYRNGTRFDAEEVEDRFDQDCAERQDLALDVGRALKVPNTSTQTPEQYAATLIAAHDETIQAAAEVAQWLEEVGSDIGDHTYVTAADTPTARTLAGRFADIVNVKDFGAKGDGETDDAAAINAAILAGTGKAVWFPAGVYLTSTGIRIPSDTAVFGSGEEATIIKLTCPWSCTDCITNATNFLHFKEWGDTHGYFTTETQQANTGNSNIFLGYLTVDGNGNRDNYTAVAGSQLGSAVHFANVHNVKLEHVKAINGRLHCIDVSSTMYTMHHDSEADTVYTDESDSICGNWYIGKSSNVVIDKCTGIDPVRDDCITTHYSEFINIYAPYSACSEYSALKDTTTGLEIDDGCCFVNVFGGYAKNCEVGFVSKGHSNSFPAYSVNVQGFMAEACRHGFMLSHDTPDDPPYLDHAVRSTLKDCCAKNLQANGNALYIVRVHDCLIENFTVYGNEETTYTGAPVLITKEAYDCLFRGIYFYNINYGDFGLVLINSSAGNGLKFERIIATNCDGSYVMRDARVGSAMSIDGLFGYTTSSENNKAILSTNISNLFEPFTTISNISGSGYAVDIMDNYSNTFGHNEIQHRSIVGEGGQAVYKRAYSTGSQDPAPSYFQRYGIFQSGSTMQTGEMGLIGFEYKDSTNETPPVTIGYVGVKKNGPGVSWGLEFGTYFAREEDSVSTKWSIISDGMLLPSLSGEFPIGRNNNKVKELWAANGTIQTSDIRAKDNLAAPSEALMRAWGKVNFKVFQMRDAIVKKGAEAARLHVGVIAQEVQSAFASEGLDAGRYGLFCFDSWNDEFEDVEIEDRPPVVDESGNVLEPAVTHTERRQTQTAGDGYAIRYEEALALECAYQRWRLEQMEARLAALEVQ